MATIVAGDMLRGLNRDEVTASRSRFGSNVLTQKKRKGFLMSLLGNFGDPMIKVLLIALGINVVFLFGHSNWFESMGIAVAILIAIVVSTVSEYGSESAFKKLQQQAQDITGRVRRDGRTVILPVSELVTGDIVFLGAGERIPADGVIISGRLQADQSALNGESKEADKFPSAGAANGKENDFLDSGRVFCGTTVTGGEGVMRITAVGDSTFYGKLAAEIQEQTPDSPLKLKLAKLAKKISFYGYIGAALVAFSYLFNVILINNRFDGVRIMAMFQDWRVIFSHFLNAMTLAVTVIVMAVPEGLPMMITVVLSSNMRRMLKDNVLVRKLNGIETAGSMNILFTDKTGTLTYGKPDVISIVTGDGKIHKAAEFKPEGLAAVFSLSLAHNNGAEMVDGRGAGGNATDRALLEYAQKLPLQTGYRKISSVPFSSVNKYMATTVTGRGSTRTLIKGAPEKILQFCTHYYAADGSVRELSSRAAVASAAEELSTKAVRVLAMAVSETEIREGQAFSNLIFVGLTGIRDMVRSEAVRGVSQVQAAGIQTVMITGDNKNTAVAIARETGILKDGGLVLTSDEMAAMTDDALAAALKDLRVVARALPSDKSRLVRIAQSLNLVAGMTGDGVNDAPALKKADIGFAMGSGTEVAKEAGDVVILDDNILSISRAVSYGRTIFKSIRKFIIFQLSINFCAMAVSVIAPLINIDTPITVIQMLWINLVMDTLAGLAFGGERPRAKYMLEPPKKRDEPIINGYMWQQVVITSVYTALLSIWFLKSPMLQGSFAGHGPAYTMTAFFALFMFMAIFNSFCARTHELNLLDYLALNKQFIWIMSSIVVIQILLVYFGGSIFRTQGLTFAHFALIIGLAVTVVPLDLLRKLLTKKRFGGAGT